MSTRSSPGSVTASWVLMEHPPSWWGPPYALQGPFVNVTKWVDSVTFGDNVPDWRRKLASGQEVTTTLNGDRTTAVLTDGHATFTYMWGGSLWRDELTGSHGIDVELPPGNFSELDEAKANAVALGRLNQSIRRRTTALEGGIFLGEIGQTLQMIRNPARGLRRAVDDFYELARAIRRGRLGQRLSEVKLTEHLADAWLEAQFGWRPFISDIRGGAEALRRYRDGHAGTLRITGTSGLVRGSSVDGTTTGYAFGAAGWLASARTVGDVSIIYRGAMRVEAKDPREMDPALIGFDLSSWAPTLWELIPYSFLIDYFSNIGDVIRGWSQMGVRLAWCNRTSRKTFTKTAWSSPSGVFPAQAFSAAKFVCTRVRVSRASYSGTTVPKPILEIPSLGSLKWLNIAALIANRRADRNWVYGN